VKNHLAMVVLVGGILGAQETPAPVAVEEEPLHQTVFKNESVIVFHLILPPGERTLYHTHVRDRVGIEFSNTSTTEQLPGKAEGAAGATKAGDFFALTLGESPFSHRVHNVGPNPFVVMDVEILQRPKSVSGVAAAPVAAENPSARVYNWVLAPGATAATHSHVRPYLIVAATAFNLKMTAPDGKTFSHELKAGDFHWVEEKVTHSLSNAGSTEGQILEVELK
jgi:quercetin dioxygenase-like cupin family protein